MSSPNDYSRLRVKIPDTPTRDYAKIQAYNTDPANWFKNSRGECPWPPPEGPRQHPYHQRITVVDGMDGLTPDMLRVRDVRIVSGQCPYCQGVGYV